MAGRRKYGNKTIEINGLTFDSKKEGYYYLFLLQQLRDRKIRGFRRQVQYEIVPAVYETEVKHFKRKPDEVREKCVQPAVHYIADFVTTLLDGTEEVVDVKSEATRKDKVYVLKKKMMRAFNGITIVEV